MVTTTLQTKLLGNDIDPHLASVLAHNWKNADVQLCVTASLEDDPIPDYVRVQLSDAFQQRFEATVKQRITAFKTAWERGKLELVAYDPGCDLNSHEVAYEQLAHAPDVAKNIERLQHLPDLPYFDKQKKQFQAHMHSQVTVLILPDLPPLYCFRRYTSRTLLDTKGTGLWGIFDGDCFAELSSPILQLDGEIDCLCWGEHIFVLDKSGYEKVFRDGVIVQQEGELALSIIRDSGLVENFDALQTDCLAHTQKLAKLRNMKNRGMLTDERLRDLPRLKKVIEDYDVNVSIIHVNGEERLLYNPKAKWDLLKLLDDDFVLSELTGNRYVAGSKRKRQRQRHRRR